MMILDAGDLGELWRALHGRGYTVVGPRHTDGAIVLSELTGPADLATGWGVRAEAGRYRTVRRADGAVFAHSAGPRSWKQWLHPPRRRLMSIDRDGDGFTVTVDGEPPPKLAFLGVRPCDLAAIRVLDRVLARGRHPEPAYTARRDGVFVVAVNCTEPGATCFCVSMGGGPRAEAGYDLALTERVDAAGHRFLVEAATPAGAAVLSDLPARAATGQDAALAEQDLVAAAGRMGRAMPPVDLHALMAGSRRSPHWDDVASRCLSCANCTLVCPTCFCTTTEDVTDLTGEHAERWQRWDSCFTADFSHLHGAGPVRAGTASRYRQWISHKLGAWADQFGGSGCVGCGRCIAWCPAGIDITVEAARLARLASDAEPRDARPRDPQPAHTQPQDARPSGARPRDARAPERDRPC